MVRKSMYSIIIFISFVLSACGNTTSMTETPELSNEEVINGEVTEITQKDIISYISEISRQAVLVETDPAFIVGGLSYDSDIIKNIDISSSDIDTGVLGECSVSYMLTIDTNAYCEKEHKRNATNEDTAMLRINTSVQIVDREQAEQLEENGADVIGFND